MERCLAVDISAVDVDFFVGEKCDRIMNVAVVDGREHNFVAHLFDLSDHF